MTIFLYVCTQGNTIQFNPSAHLYQPADAGVMLHYSLNSLDNNDASFTVQVTSDTVNGASFVRLNNIQYHYMCVDPIVIRRDL